MPPPLYGLELGSVVCLLVWRPVISMCLHYVVCRSQISSSIHSSATGSPQPSKCNSLSSLYFWNRSYLGCLRFPFKHYFRNWRQSKGVLSLSRYHGPVCL